MSKSQKLTVTVFRVERIRNSINGGPAYKFHTDHGQFRTQSDTMQAWAMGNTFEIGSSINSGDGVQAILTMTPAGRVFDWELVK